MASRRERTPDPEYVEIGRRLRAAREAQRRTQMELATELGIAEATYGRREAGLIRWPLPDLARVAHVLGLTLDDLWPGTPAPALSPPRPPVVLLRELEAWIAASEPTDPELRALLARANQLPPEREHAFKRWLKEFLDGAGPASLQTG